MELITREDFLYFRVLKARRDLKKRQSFQPVLKTVKTIHDLKEKFAGQENLIKALLKAKKK